MNRGRRGQYQVERIAQAHAASQQVDGGASTEASGDTQSIAIRVDVWFFKIRELAVRRFITAHVVAAVLSEHLLGQNPFERGEAQFQLRGLRPNRRQGQKNQRQSHHSRLSL